ncbi:MAG: hypothetical protein Q4B72_02140 [Lachnospiraceae bacterium]|nr:hypothetical protein [Lachnospiraceae bacterium]
MNSYKGLEMQFDEMQKKRLIFSELFVLQNKMQTRFDKFLGDITSKQFIILIIVAAFPSPPSLTEVAKHAGCSRQNVKKVAAVLEKNGYLSLVSEKETRAVRIVLTQKYYDFIEPLMNKMEDGLEKLFQGFTKEQLNSLFLGLHHFEENVDQL